MVGKVVLGQLKKSYSARVKAVVRGEDAEKDLLRPDTQRSPRCTFHSCRASVNDDARPCLMGIITNSIMLSYVKMVRKNLTVVGQFLSNRNTIGRVVRMMASVGLDFNGL